MIWFGLAYYNFILIKFNQKVSSLIKLSFLRQHYSIPADAKYAPRTPLFLKILKHNGHNGQITSPYIT